MREVQEGDREDSNHLPLKIEIGRREGEERQREGRRAEERIVKKRIWTQKGIVHYNER